MAEVRAGRSGRGRRGRVAPRWERLEDRTLLSLDFVAGRGLGGLNGFESAGVATNAAGEIYVAGSFFGTVDFEPGGTLPGNADVVTSVNNTRDLYVAKYTARGSLLWVQATGGTFDDRASGVAVDAAGSAYVTGFFTGQVSFGGPNLTLTSPGADLFAWKLTSAGVPVWATGSVGTQGLANQSLGVAVNPQGTVVGITGFILGATTFGSTTLTPASGARDSVVARLDGATGAFVAARQLAMSPNGLSQGERVAIDAAGAIVTTGAFQGTIDLDPGAGQALRTTNGSIDAYVSKLDAAGNFVYGLAFGGTGVDIGYDVEVDAAGNAYALGRYFGQVDFDPSAVQPGGADVLTSPAGLSSFYVLRVSPAGAFAFVRDLGARNTNTGPTTDLIGRPGIALDAAGNLLATVGFTGTATVGAIALASAGGSDILVARLTSQGGLLSGAIRAGGGGNDTPTGLESKGAAAVAFTANYAGATAVFGDKPLANTGQANVAIARLTTRAFDDFDADQRADLAVYRPTTAQWLVRQSGGGVQTPSFGAANIDMPVPADYDGDGRIDVAVFRPSTATWFIRFSGGGSRQFQFGASNLDLPVPGDFDNDGRADLALFRRTTSQWLIEFSTGGTQAIQFGAADLDQPVPADFDGDGRTDLAVFRPNTATWFILQSTAGGRAEQFGGVDIDRPVPADYDGDNRADLAVFRPSTATWLIRQSSAGGRAEQFGGVDIDQPIPADFDGDGRTDLAVFRPAPAQWLSRLSGGGVINEQFGAPNVDVSLASPVVFRFNGSLGNVGIFGGSTVHLATAAIGGGEGATGGVGQKSAARRRPAAVAAVDLALESPDLGLRPAVASA